MYLFPMNDKKNFETLYFLKWCLIFDGSALRLLKKYNKFSRVLMLIFGQNSSCFCIPPWTLDHPNFPQKSQCNKLKMKNGSSAQAGVSSRSSMQTSNMYILRTNLYIVWLWVNYVVVYQRTTGPLGPVLKKILEDRSVQDLKITKRTSKDLFFDQGTIYRFFKMSSLEF